MKVSILAMLMFALTSQAQEPQGETAVRATYTKYELEIPMRDGVKLFTAVYVPKDTAQTYPIMFMRTPYSVSPYGVDHFRSRLGPSELFQESGYILLTRTFAGVTCLRATWEEMRPHQPVKTGPNDTDESTDTWDTIDWLVKNIPGNNGKVGMWGVSYPGFYVSAGMIDAHPALVAASPQAPVTDLYLGDDAYHNGAFMLAANFGFYTFFIERKGDPAPPERRLRFDYKTPDGYDFFLKMGTLSRGNEEYSKNENRYWMRVRRKHHLQRLLEGALYLEAFEVRQAGRHGGGWLVRCRRSPRTRTHPRLHGRQQPAGNQPAGARALDAWRLVSR